MIELYYWPTPNGHKITMFLEETGLEYTIHPVDIGAGDQFKPEFLAISPNNRMPAIIDRAPADGGEPISVFESGAILLYLAEKTGQLPAEGHARPQDCDASGCSGRWAAWGRWPGRTTISRSTRPRKSLTRSTATSRRRTGSTACSTGSSKTVRSSPATTTASPTWPPIPGSFRGSASSRIWTTSRTCERWFVTVRARPGTQRAYARGERYSSRPTVTEEGKKILFGQTASRASAA